MRQVGYLQRYPDILNTGCPKKIVLFSKILLFGGRHLETFVPTGMAGISLKRRSI
jgi:hypothetical protein